MPGELSLVKLAAIKVTRLSLAAVRYTVPRSIGMNRIFKRVSVGVSCADALHHCFGAVVDRPAGTREAYKGLNRYV